MKLESFLSQIEYKITDGSKFHWDCYGLNAWSITSDRVEAVFDRITLMIYEVSVHYASGDCYKWIDPEFVNAYVNESRSKGFDPWIAYDDVPYKQELLETEILSLIK
jgi:hypothetical protein